MGKKHKRQQPGNLFPEIRVYACTTFEEARRLAKKHLKGDIEESKSADATAYTADNGISEYAVVLVKGFDGSAAKIATLAHECSHVVGQFLDMLGEESNDSEFRAYLIQSCMLACLEQLGYGEPDK